MYFNVKHKIVFLKKKTQTIIEYYSLQPDGYLVLLYMLFLWPRLHVTGESGIRIRNFLNSLSRVEIFEYAMSPESSGR